MIGDWDIHRIEGLITQQEILFHPTSGARVCLPSDGWFGMRASAYDSGDPERILDVIQLESHVDRIHDHTVKAAIILRMHGFSEEQLSSLIRSHLTGAELVKKGIQIIHDTQGPDRVDAS